VLKDDTWRNVLKTYSTIVVSDCGSVRTITLNRPERRNAMTPEMQSELLAAFEDAAASSCRVLVLSGAGDAFCSGLDLAELQSATEKTIAEHRADAVRIAQLFLALHELPIPTIAVVHGPAIAGGTGLAIICDFTLATPAARFGFTEVRIGFVPALVSAFLALQLGHKQRMELFLTGRIFGAEEAFVLAWSMRFCRTIKLPVASTSWRARCSQTVPRHCAPPSASYSRKASSGSTIRSRLQSKLAPKREQLRIFAKGLRHSLKNDERRGGNDTQH
jgi:1,4-dihydroxy-2-naphthoyl-CoA synthase